MDPIPDDIRGFLGQNIDSIEQLEILRVLGEDPGREWDADALSLQVQAPPPAVAAHLEALHARGLLATAPRDKAVVWRHGPRTPELADLVGRLLAFYRQRPVTTINLVYDRARKALEAFADAFRLRKEG